MMRQYNFCSSNQNGIESVSYLLQPSEIYDESVFNKINGLPDIIPFQVNNSVNGVSIVSYVNYSTTLAMHLNAVLDKKSVLAIVSGIIDVFELGMKGIPISYVVTDINKIYYDNATGTLKFLLMPIKQEALPLADIAGLLRFVLSVVKYSDQDTDNYVAKLFAMINSSDFTLSRLRFLVEKQLQDIGCFYSKESGVMLLSERNILETNIPETNVPEAVINNVAETPTYSRIEETVLGNMTQAVEDVNIVGSTEKITSSLETLGNKYAEPISRSIQGSIIGQLNVKPVPHMIRKRTGEVINITKNDFKIGKSRVNADYTIENNSAISRVHCIIVQHDGVNYIIDNNSTNHTYLNGVMVEPGKEMLLKNRTIVQMGDEEFTFLLRKGD